MTQKTDRRRMLLESGVIVCSILLAFGIEASWDGLQERAAERDYLERIVADLTLTRENIVGRSDHYGKIAEHGQAVLPIIAGMRPIPQDTLGFLTSVLEASRMVEPVVARSAYDDLISTGNLRVIRDRALRIAVSEFYSGIDYQLSPFDYELDKIPYREVVRGIIPADLQFAIRNSCFDTAPLKCPDGSGVTGVGRVAEALAAEPELDRKLNVTLQALMIRPGNTMGLAGAVSAGFGLVIDNIDALLELLESTVES